MTTTSILFPKLVPAIVNHLTKQATVAKAGEAAEDVADVVETIIVISCLDKGDAAICDAQGIWHSISDYEVAPQFERLVSPRGVTIDDSDFAKDLRVNTLDSIYGRVSEREFNTGYDDENEYLNKLPKSLQLKVVPLSPAEFKSAQIRIVNKVKGHVDRWTSIEELSNPILLSAVNVIATKDAGNEMTYMPEGDLVCLPISLTISDELYKHWKYNYPVDEYIDNFAFHLVFDMVK